MKRFSLLLIANIVLGTSFFIKEIPSYANDVHYVEIPVRFYPTPVIDIVIEGKTYAVQLDLGAPDLFLRKEVMEIVQEKEFVQEVEYADVNGNQYVHQRYVLSSMEIMGAQFNRVPISNEHLEMLISGNKVWRSPNEICERTQKEVSELQGRLGIDPLKRCCCFFDFSNSEMVIAENINELSKIRSLCGFVELELLSFDHWVIIPVETEVGTFKFILDTGASHSMLRKSLNRNKNAKEIEPGKHCLSVEKFAIGQKEFGPRDLLLFDFFEEIQFDGFLGEDFFNEHSVCLDFLNNKCYIGHSSIKNK